MRYGVFLCLRRWRKHRPFYWPYEQKKYNYEYEEGRIVRATEADIELSGEIVTSKVIVNTVKYYYDTEGKMTKKVITPASGSAQTI